MLVCFFVVVVYILDCSVNNLRVVIFIWELEELFVFMEFVLLFLEDFVKFGKCC